MDLKTPITILILSIPFFALTVWAIVDASRKDFGTMGKKAIWVMVAAVPFAGFLIYLLFGFRKGKKIPELN